MKRQLLPVVCLIVLALLTTGPSRGTDDPPERDPDERCLCGGQWPHACRHCPGEASQEGPAFCASRGKNCGLIYNGQGGQVDCGTCKAEDTCGGGGVPNVCGCTPKTCAAKERGSIDRGCGLGTVTCGYCPSGFLRRDGFCAPIDDDRECPCGGRWPNACQICDGLISEVPRDLAFCAAQEKNCGLIYNGRGGQVDCGTCKGEDTCGGSGVPNVCSRPDTK